MPVGVRTTLGELPLKAFIEDDDDFWIAGQYRQKISALQAKINGPVLPRLDSLELFDSDLMNGADPTKGAAFVGYLGGNLYDLPELFVANTTGTGNLWIGDDPPANIHRLRDRVFIGDLADNDGANPTVSATWLGQTPQPGLSWIERNATGGSYASKGAIGWVGAAHTEELISVGAAAIGLVGVGVNDNSGTQTNAWALYLDAKSNADALGPTWSAELEITNLGTYVGDYDASPRKTFGLDIGAGGDPAINGATESVTLGMRFFANGANFGGGISFGAGSLRQFTDTESIAYFRAMILRANMAVAWESAAGASLGKVWSTVSSQSNETSVHLTNDNVLLKGAAGARIAQFLHSAGAVNHVSIANNVATAAPLIASVGSDTNIDLRLSAKGTGVINIIQAATAAAVPGNFSATHYFNIKLNGVIYRIPATASAW